jgi:hypothetical protein
MKLNELLTDFTIYTNNEERLVLENLNGLVPITLFTEREQVIINNLIKKSLISKVVYNNQTMVTKNDI